MGSDIQADPTVFFASGVFIGVFVATAIALAACLIVGGWVLTWAARYDSFRATRRNGKIKIEAELQDTRPPKAPKAPEQRPAPRAES